MRSKLLVLSVVSAAAGISNAAITNSSNAMFDFTNLPGYGVATSAVFNMANDGWAGWSVPAGKVPLGAVITAFGGGPLTVSAPAAPNAAYPHYTFGPAEFGWVVRNGGAQQQVQLSIFYADTPDGYTITTSPLLNFASTGWGGWSAPTGHVVTGGGYSFSTAGQTPQNSLIATPGSAWPHYTFGANEAGWVVQANNSVGGQASVSVISFVPAPGAFALLGMGGLVAARRRRA